MLPLWELMMRSGGTEALARHFHLSQLQAQNALDALLPAFSEGLKRFTADPTGMGTFMGALASGQHQRYFEDASRAFAPQGLRDGNDILAHLFGSKDLSRAVADQAARMSGLGTDILRQMLPAIAAMLMGGISAQARTQPSAAPENPFAEMFATMMRQMGAATAPLPQAPPNPWTDNPWSRAMEEMLRKPQTAASPADAWGRVFAEWMGSPKPAPEPKKPADPYRAALDTMFETGRKTQDDYSRAVQSVFDQFLKGMERPKS